MWGGKMEHMTSEAKEHVQIIVWIVEAATFLTAALIARVVWRVSKRAHGCKKAQRAD
jgi:hypothetical protein